MEEFQVHICMMVFIVLFIKDLRQNTIPINIIDVIPYAKEIESFFKERTVI